MPHPSITSTGEPFRRDATNLRLLPPPKEIPGKVRLVKDLLRVGEWPIGVGADGTIQKWNVDAATLSDISTVFERQKSEGQTRPLQWGHADPKTGHANVDPEKVIDYWDSLFAENDTLWGVVYVKESVAEDLTTVKRPVSVGVDYLGNVLTPGANPEPVKNALLHVGIVDQGAMPGQGGFIQMAAKLETRKMDFAALVESINALLEYVKKGAKLPESVDETNINLALAMAVSLLTGAEAAVEEEEEPDEEAPAIGPVEGMPPEMAQMAAPLIKHFDKLYGGKIAQLNASLALVTGKQGADKKAAFAAHVDGLCSAGIPASSRDALINVGASNDWDINSLSGLPGVDAALVQMGSKLTTRIPETNKEVQIREYETAFAKTYPPTVARRMAENVVNRA